MCSFLHKSLRWECNRETRQIHEKKSVARALYFRPPSSTGANGGNRGSSLSPLPLLPPVQKSQCRSLTPNYSLYGKNSMRLDNSPVTWNRIFLPSIAVRIAASCL